MFLFLSGFFAVLFFYLLVSPGGDYEGMFLPSFSKNRNNMFCLCFEDEFSFNIETVKNWQRELRRPVYFLTDVHQFVADV